MPGGVNGIGGADRNPMINIADFEVVDMDAIRNQQRTEAFKSDEMVTSLMSVLSNDREVYWASSQAIKECSGKLAAVLVDLQSKLASLPANTECRFSILVDDKVLTITQDVNGMLEAAISPDDNPEDAVKFDIPLSASRLSSLIVKDMIASPKLYPEDALLEAIDKDDGTCDMNLRREVYETIIEAKTGIKPGSLTVLNHIAMRTLAMHALTTKDSQITRDLADVMLKDRQYVQDVLNLNDEQAIEIMENFDRQNAHNPSDVKNKVNVSTLKNIRAPKELTDEQRTALEMDVKLHNFIADLVLNNNGYEHDKVQGAEPGKRVFDVFIKHLEIVEDVLKDNKNEMLKSFPKEMQDDLGKVMSLFRGAVNAMKFMDNSVVKGTVNFFKNLFGGNSAAVDEAAQKEKTTADYIKQLFDENEELMVGLESQIDDLCNEVCNKVSVSIKDKVKQLKESLSSARERPTLNDVIAEKDPKTKIEKFLRMNGKILHRIATNKEVRNAVRAETFKPQEQFRLGAGRGVNVAAERMAGLVKKLASLDVDKNGVMAIKYEDSDENCIYSASENDVIKYCMSMFNVNGNDLEVDSALHNVFKLNNKGDIVFGIPDFEEKLDSYLQALADDPGAVGDQQSKRNYKSRINNIISACPKIFQPTLKEMQEESVDPTRGYPQLVLQVMEKYFDVPENLPQGEEVSRQTDRRAMVASMLRNVRCEPNSDPNEAQVLGGLFKGAGPIMQKALQGLKIPDNIPELREAVKDMKSNLAPIPPEYVEAQLLDIVERSHGEIRNITVTKSLGAASVGQAFLCSVVTRNGEEKQCVLKLLRPDALTRALRERTLFENEANTIGGGMPMTFKGKLDVILREFDFTIEAKNVKLGTVYDQNIAKGFGETGVESMKLLGSIPTTAGAMLLELAPGQNVGNFCESMEHEVSEVSQTFSGKILNDEDIPAEDILKQCKNLAVMKACSTRLMALTKQWTREGIFGSGFYHGDLHAGNIMFDSQLDKIKDRTLKEIKEVVGNMTVIDFGNAVQLSKTQQANVTKMMMGCVVGDAKWFIPAYKDLLSDKGEAFEEADVVRCDNDGYVIDADGEFVLDEEGNRMKYAGLADKEGQMSIYTLDDAGNPTGIKEVRKRTYISSMLERIISAGSSSNVATRIVVALTHLQNHGIECPPEIFNFASGYLLLQNTSDQLADGIDNSRSAIFDAIQHKTEKMIYEYFDSKIKTTPRTEKEKELRKKQKDLQLAEKELKDHLKESLAAEKTAQEAEARFDADFNKAYVQNYYKKLREVLENGDKTVIGDADAAKMLEAFTKIENARGTIEDKLPYSKMSVRNAYAALITALEMPKDCGVDYVFDEIVDNVKKPLEIKVQLNDLFTNVQNSVVSQCEVDMLSEWQTYKTDHNLGSRWRDRHTTLQNEINGLNRELDSLQPDDVDKEKIKRDKILELKTTKEKLEALESLKVEGAKELRKMLEFREKNDSDSAMEAVGKALTSSIRPFLKNVDGIVNAFKIGTKLIFG